MHKYLALTKAHLNKANEHLDKYFKYLDRGDVSSVLIEFYKGELIRTIKAQEALIEKINEESKRAKENPNQIRIQF